MVAVALKPWHEAGWEVFACISILTIWIAILTVRVRSLLDRIKKLEDK